MDRLIIVDFIISGIILEDIINKNLVDFEWIIKEIVKLPI